MPTMNHLHNKVHWLNQMINNMGKEMRNIKGRDSDQASAVNGHSVTDNADLDSNPDVYNYEFKFLDEKPDERRLTDNRPYKSSRNKDHLFSFFYPENPPRNETHSTRREENSKSKSATKEKPTKEYSQISQEADLLP